MNSPTPNEIKELRDSLALTQSQSAMLLHVNLRTWQKWEAGDRAMHPAFWELFKIKAKHTGFNV